MRTIERPHNGLEEQDDIDWRLLLRSSLFGHSPDLEITQSRDPSPNIIALSTGGGSLVVGIAAANPEAMGSTDPLHCRH